MLYIYFVSTAPAASTRFAAHDIQHVEAGGKQKAYGVYDIWLRIPLILNSSDAYHMFDCTCGKYWVTGLTCTCPGRKVVGNIDRHIMRPIANRYDNGHLNEIRCFLKCLLTRLLKFAVRGRLSQTIRQQLTANNFHENRLTSAHIVTLCSRRP